MRSPDPFRYPDAPHVRRHGPQGYLNYRHYRDWLRDEFRFRCVFCLAREQWSQVKSLFDIDHFQPQVLRPDMALEYDNLLYTCRTCNSDKSSSLVPDPCVYAYGRCLKVYDDGTIHALDSKGQILIDELDLDARSKNEFRKLFISIVKLAANSHETKLLETLLGLPLELPELKRKPPLGNTRPQGVGDSWAAKKNRGEVLTILE